MLEAGPDRDIPRLGFLRGSYSTCYLVALECTIHNIEHDIGQIFNVGGIPEGPVPSTWTYSVLAGGFTVVWYHSGKHQQKMARNKTAATVVRPIQTMV